MSRRPTKSTRTATLVPDTTLFRSPGAPADHHAALARQMIEDDRLTVGQRDALHLFIENPGRKERPRRGDARKNVAHGRESAESRHGGRRAFTGPVIENAFDPGREIVHVRAIADDPCRRSEEHTSELQSLMRIASAVFCLKK